MDNELDEHALEAENFHNPRVSSEAYNFLVECVIFMIKEYDDDPNHAWIPMLDVEDTDAKALLKRLSAELKVSAEMVQAQFPYFALSAIKELTNG